MLRYEYRPNHHTQIAFAMTNTPGPSIQSEESIQLLHDAIHHLNNDDIEKASICLSGINLTDPDSTNDANYNWILGIIMQKQGKTEFAIDLFKKSYRRFPKRIEFSEALGSTYLARGIGLYTSSGIAVRA